MVLPNDWLTPTALRWRFDANGKFKMVSKTSVTFGRMMKHLSIYAAIALAFATSTPLTSAQPTAEAVVQAQLEAYNARDLDAFIATYADDVKLFELPEKLLSEGTAAMREQYGTLFKDERLHATIVKRIVMADTVVDHERVRLTFPQGPGTVEAIAIYEVRDGRITKVWFRHGERKLDGASASP